jgi:LuxR family transcriptional regulator, maltose regulon positive regulatory protein
MKAKVRNNHLYPDPDHPGLTISVGSDSWHTWLSLHEHFVYEGENCHFTARKEFVRGNPYWYGYRRSKGSLRKIYLGKAADLTIERFKHADQKLVEENIDPGPNKISSAAIDTHIEDANEVNIPFSLNTRLIPPTLPNNLVPRPRLMRQLDLPITLISAPSGFGKTTLLSQWRAEKMSSSGEYSHTAWVFLDSEEHDEHRFWTIIVTALQQIDTQIGSTISILLHSPARQPIDDILVNLIQNISKWQANRSDRRLALIIDDYQWVSSTSIHASLQFFLDHLPAATQVILASQTQYLFAIERWQARGILTQLSADDLLLSAEEGMVWLGQSISVTLTEREKLMLGIMAGGWAAGFNLLMLALKNQGDVHQFIPTFDGYHPLLQGYFIEQILKKQSDDQQAFLIKTSILANLNGSLCDAVTDQTNSATILQNIHQKNLFITLVDKELEWYRYHELFSKALQYQLQNHYENLILDLHRKAARWYQENGFYSEAIRHLLQVGEWKKLDQIIEQVILDELQKGSDHRVLRWMQQLPDEIFLHHDGILLMYARLAKPSLPEGQVENLLDHIKRKIEAVPISERSIEYQAVITRLDEWNRTVAVGEEINPPKPNTATIDKVGYMLDLQYQAVCCLLREGKITESEYMLKQAMKLGQEQGIVYVVLYSGGTLASLITMQGRLREGEKLAHQVLNYGLAQTRTPAPSASITMTVLAKISYARNQLEHARKYIDDAVILDPHPTSLNMVIHHNLLLSFLLNAQGDSAGALTALQAGIQLEPYATQTINAQDLKIYQALLYIRQHKVELAELNLRQICGYPLPPNLTENGLLKATWAELFLAQQQYKEVEAILTNQGRISLHTSTFDTRPHLELLLAMAYWGQKKFYQARQEMIKAIRFADPERIVRPFLDFGPSLVPLLIDILQIKRLSAMQRKFSMDLINLFKISFPDQSISLIEQTSESSMTILSPREREILVYLDRGLDNQSLAYRLNISESTVRTHLRNIYQKLQVSSRIMAINKARAQKLI